MRYEGGFLGSRPFSQLAMKEPMMIRYQNALLRANCLDILPRLATDRLSKRVGKYILTADKQGECLQ